MLQKFLIQTIFEQTSINVKLNAGLVRMFHDQLLNCVNAKTASLSPPMAKIVDKSLNVADVVAET